MAIKQDFITGTKIGNFTVQEYKCHKSNYRVGSKRDIQYVVIHYTGNTKDLAVNNCKYFASANRSASSHFFVDETSIYQSVSIKDVAWHCGSSQGQKGKCDNDNSIGIEMCCSGNYLVSMTTQNNALELVAYIWKEQGWDVEDIDTRLLRHYDCVKSNKKCPAQFVNNPAEWTNFKGRLKTMLNQKNTASKIKLQQYGAYFKNIDRIAYVPMKNSKGETVSAAAASTIWNGRYPDAICNGELYNMSTFQPGSGVVADGKAQLLPEAFGIAFVDNKKPVLSYKNNVKAKDWIGAYPMLVRDKKRAFTATPSGLGGRRARTALAFNDEKFSFIYVTANDGCTLEEFADAIILAGYHTAINLDGGGSTACITPGVAYEQGRKVRGKIAMWVKDGKGNKLANNSSIKTTSTSNSNSSSNRMKQDATKSKGVKLTVTAWPSLRLRQYAPDGKTIEYIKRNAQVNWYGYYTEIDGVIWYYVKTASGNTGYISSKYVK